MNVVYKAVKYLQLTLFFLILNHGLAFAGAIPEEIMLGKQQALFIGKLADINEKTYTITPLTVMMGSIPQQELKVKKFSRYYGNEDTPKVNDFLVAVLLTDNEIDSLWVFKASSDDYKTLKLLSEKYNMVKTYEEYINEGKYFEAQKRLDKETQEQGGSLEQSNQAENVNAALKKSNANFTIFAILSLTLLAGIAFILRKGK